MRCRWPSIAAAIIAAAAASAPATVSAQAAAKPKPRAALQAELKRLDAKLEDLRETFVRDTDFLIKGYEDAGQPDRAKSLLEAIGRLDPKNEAIKRKIADLQRKILDNQEFELEIDPTKTWQPVGSVVKDDILRIRAAGEYTCSLRIAAGPEGVPASNPAEDIVGHVPLGAMMAVITPGVPEKEGRPPKPFLVGEDFEKPAERSGILFLRVNLPPKSECKGKVSVRVSGVTRPE